MYYVKFSFIDLDGIILYRNIPIDQLNKEFYNRNIDISKYINEISYITGFNSEQYYLFKHEIIYESEVSCLINTELKELFNTFKYLGISPSFLRHLNIQLLHSLKPISDGADFSNSNINGFTTDISLPSKISDKSIDKFYYKRALEKEGFLTILWDFNSLGPSFKIYYANNEVGVNSVFNLNFQHFETFKEEFFKQFINSINDCKRDLRNIRFLYLNIYDKLKTRKDLTFVNLNNCKLFKIINNMETTNPYFVHTIYDLDDFKRAMGGYGFNTNFISDIPTELTDNLISVRSSKGRDMYLCKNSEYSSPYTKEGFYEYIELAKQGKDFLVLGISSFSGNIQKFAFMYAYKNKAFLVVEFIKPNTLLKQINSNEADFTNDIFKKIYKRVSNFIKETLEPKNNNSNEREIIIRGFQFNMHKIIIPL